MWLYISGVSIVIPKGAIPEGVSQEIYFKVCKDNNILPPLDKDKGLYYCQIINLLEAFRLVIGLLLLRVMFFEV